MLTPYSDFSARRSVYSVLLFLAVSGPFVTAALTIAGVRAHWVEIVSLFAALLGIPLLCIWCAIYVEREPRLVRIALAWIAMLFLFILGAILTHPTISRKHLTRRWSERLPIRSPG
jgi:cytochrome bd-type quinol oxidase subunit 2